MRAWTVGLAALTVAFQVGCADPIRVDGSIQDVRLTAPRQVLVVGDTARFTAAAIDPEDVPIVGADIAWSTSNPDVAVVDADGLVSALTAGKATIRISLGSHYDEVAIEVKVRSDLRIVPVVTLHDVRDSYAGTNPFGPTTPWRRMRIRGTAPDAVRLKAYSYSPGLSRSPDVEIPLRGDPAASAFDTILPFPNSIVHLVAHDANGDSVGYVASFLSIEVPKVDFDPAHLEDRFAPLGAPSTEIRFIARGRSPISRIAVVAEGSAIQEIPVAQPDTVVPFRWTPTLTDSVTLVWIHVETATGHTLSQSAAIGRTSPPSVPGAWSRVTGSSCGLNLAGKAYCWAASSLTPQPVLPGVSFDFLSGVEGHTCGLTDAGVAHCWTTEHGSGSVAGGSLSFRQLSSGIGRSCGVTVDYQAYCWDAPRWADPVAVAPDLQLGTIAAGYSGNQYSHLCALDREGAAYCWGSNGDGEVGNGSKGSRVSEPTRVAATEKFVDIAVYLRSSCALTEDGRVFCWGILTSCHDGTTVPCGDTSIPREIPANNRFLSLQIGPGMSPGPAVCGRTSSGELYCWEGGALKPPVPVHPSLSFSSFAMGPRHRCGVLANGAAYCWGDGEGGQLGNGTRNDVTEPVRVIDRF